MTIERRCGKVYLVGAGPGDPGLLTLKGCEALKRCDVVIYDALVNPALLEHVPLDAERIFVGESRAAERIDQAEVHRLMIERARQGKIVVRLKGGDPFIFGRGGEEALALVAAGIEWEVVPGVSAGQAAAAYAGIPLTHRGLASSVAFVTGHECADKMTRVDWEKLASAVDTLVIFMGVRNLPRIVEALLHAGRSASTPIAIIESGTYSIQRARVASLGTILSTLENDPIYSPALIVVGDVVSLHEHLSWFDSIKPAKEGVGEVEEMILASGPTPRNPSYTPFARPSTPATPSFLFSPEADHEVLSRVP